MTKRYVIHIIEQVGPNVNGKPLGRPDVPVYIRGADVEAHEGMGEVELTADPYRAKSFGSLESALAFWNQQSKVRPTREDGKPNRPLMAYTVSIDPIDDKKGSLV